MRRSWRQLVVILTGVVCVTAGCYRPQTARYRSETVSTREAIDIPWPSEEATPAAIPPTPTPLPPPSPAYSGTYVGTPTPNPTPARYSDGSGVESYVVQAGQTLLWIAGLFDTTVEEIVAANGLPNADSISAGQKLVIPVAASRTGPDSKLIPDSELVYGPAYIHFDLADFVAEQGGYLATYSEEVEGQLLTGAEVVELISQRYSVGPRVLLALLELQSGWVSDPKPAAEALQYPLGHVQAYYEGLFRQSEWAADRLNEGYYGWKWGDRTTVRLADEARIGIAPGLNPGTAGVQNCLAALSSTWSEWIRLTGRRGFLSTYEELFGNPFAYAVEPLVPEDLVAPQMQLPWEAGVTWYLTGGPHGAYADGSGLAALDFAPSEEHLGCAPSAEWTVATAPGLVVRSEDGSVLLDLDGDGYEQSGWVVFYLHVDAEDRVGAGTYLEPGERIGHPSCEGGFSEATHLHFARRYNGEWIHAGRGPASMVLSGWIAHDGAAPYDGTMTRDGEIRTAAECWEDDINGLTAEEPLKGILD